MTATATMRRRPTIEQLRDRAEEGGYGGGRGKMDSREWYVLCYFEPLERFLFQALRTQYPEMTPSQVSVCISVWIYAHSVSTSTYERIRDRIIWFVEEEGTNPEAPVTIIVRAFERGYIVYNDGGVVTLRQDIKDFLSQLVDKECEESDAELIDRHGREALDEINEIHRKNQAAFYERYTDHR
jgi:hypothetical protein